MAETRLPGPDGPGDERDPLASGTRPLGAGDHVGAHDLDGPTDSAIEHPTDETPEDRRVGQLLQGSIDAEELAEAVEQQEAPDAADTLEHIQLEEGGEQAAEVLAEMDVESAAEALAHMITALGVSVLEDLIDEDPAYAGRLIEEMAPDDATDLLQALPDGDRDRLLGMLGKVEAVKLRRLLDFDERSAGGMMTTDYLAVRDSMTVAEAIEAIRRAETETEWIYVFVVDWRATLKGRVTMRRLLLGRPEQKIIELCDSPVDAVHPEMPREEVAREFEKYDYLVLPVVDEQHRLLGVITVDDVIDSIREESTEDAQMMVGAGKEEAVFSTTAEKFRSRLPWLIVNLFTSSLAAIVVIQFAQILDAIWILAAIMPVIANQAGNAGQQSLAVTLRGIVLDQVRPQTVRSLIFREGLVGFLNGTCNGLLVGGIVALLEWILVPGTNAWGLGAVVAIAMTVALTVGCVVGTSVPLLLRRFGADPATASTIFLTMVTDSFSFFTFLGLAVLLQNWFLAPVTA
jgi:magnesium transporter